MIKLAVVSAIGSYTASDLEQKARHLKSVLHADTEVALFVADSNPRVMALRRAGQPA